MNEKPEALRLAENLVNQWWGLTASPSGLPEVSLIAVGALRVDAARLLREQHEEIERLREANEAFGKRQEWWSEKMFQIETEVEQLRNALFYISLASQNDMSSKEECGRIARAALEAPR